MVKLVEETSGRGELLLKSLVLRQVRYEIKIFQGMFGNGLNLAYNEHFTIQGKP